MSLRQGLEIGNQLMGMGNQYAGIRDRQAKQKREEEVFQWKIADREADALTAEYAENLYKDPKWEPPEGINSKTAKPYWDANVFATNRQILESQKTKEGAMAKKAEIDKMTMEGKQAVSQFTAAANSGDEASAKELFWKWNDAYAYTGQSSIGRPTAGKIELLNWKGEKKVYDDIPVQKMAQTMTDYYANPEDSLKRTLAGRTRDADENIKISASAQMYENINDPSDIVAHVGGGKGEILRLPDGGIMPAFFTKSLNPNTPIGEMKMIEGIDLTQYKKIKDPSAAADKEKAGLEIKAKKQAIATSKASEELTKERTAVLQKTGGATAATELSSIKLQATKAFLAGKATDEQKAIIGKDKDPLLSTAIKMTVDDNDLFGATTEEKLEKVKENLKMLRAMGNDGKKTEGLSTGAAGERPSLESFVTK